MKSDRTVAVFGEVHGASRVRPAASAYSATAGANGSPIGYPIAAMATLAAAVTTNAVNGCRRHAISGIAVRIAARTPSVSRPTASGRLSAKSLCSTTTEPAATAAAIATTSNAGGASRASAGRRRASIEDMDVVEANPAPWPRRPPLGGRVSTN